MSRQTMREEVVTPERARYWLDNNALTMQRKIRFAHVKHLARMMQEGHFRESTVISFASTKNKSYLVNGYHTLNAIVMYGKPFPLTIETITVQDETAIPQIYATFDRNLGRSALDIMHGHSMSAQTGMSGRQLQSVSAAIPYIAGGFHDSISDMSSPLGLAMKDIETRLSHVSFWSRDAFQYFTAIHGGPTHLRSPLLRASCVAVGIITFHYAPEEARDFWKSAAFDDGLSQSDPRKKLLNFLLDASPESYPSLVYARYIAPCWDRFVKKMEMKSLHAQSKDTPIHIMMTPHDGRRIVRYLDNHGMPIKALIEKQRREY